MTHQDKLYKCWASIVDDGPTLDQHLLLCFSLSVTYRVNVGSMVEPALAQH